MTNLLCLDLPFSFGRPPMLHRQPAGKFQSTHRDGDRDGK